MRCCALGLRLVPVLVAVGLLSGCSLIPLPAFQVADLKVDSEPPGALVSLKKYTPETATEEEKAATDPAGTAFFARGTTPYEGKIASGHWTMRVELKGYEPVDLLFEVRTGEEATYNFDLKKD